VRGEGKGEGMGHVPSTAATEAGRHGPPARIPVSASVRLEGSPRDDARVSVLFVCLGNICRSPTAEGVMRALVREAGLQDRIELDSAGTGGWHVGESPDARATEAAGRRGIVLEGAARKVRPSDFEEFDLILAMDASNLRDLQRMASDERARRKVRLLREWDPTADGDLDVPDPYYGEPGGFDRVLDMVQAACASLLEQLRQGAAKQAAPASRDAGKTVPAQ
jgi:protein-tyrosine phosphatase